MEPSGSQSRPGRYRTSDLRYIKAYWLEINELVEDYRLSDVYAEWHKPEVIRIDASNVSRLTLDLVPKRLGEATSLQIEINRTLLTADAKPGRQLHLASDDGGKTWALAGQALRPGRIKRHGMSGPMSEAFGDRFLIVYGTVGNQAARQANQVAAERLAGNYHDVFAGTYGSFPVVPDTALTDEQVGSANLILFGGPDSNAFVQRIASDLPLKVEEDSLVFRGKRYTQPDTGLAFIYPNPVATDRYTVVACGVTAAALQNTCRLDRSLPDWVIFNERSAKGVAGNNDDPGVVEDGFFSRDWKEVKPGRQSIRTVVIARIAGPGA